MQVSACLRTKKSTELSKRIYERLRSTAFICRRRSRFHSPRLTIYREAIFFDGALPEGKRHVRLERLEKTRKQLEEFRHGHPARGTVQLPPPLIVTSAIESLRLSDWAGRAHIVPEEADVACARFAAKATISILTNDSDLALFQMRSDTRVVWLHSLVKTVHNHGSTVMQASTLIPSVVATRLGLPSLLRLGFERSLDRLVTTATVLERTRHSSQNDAGGHEYVKFCEQYSTAGSTASSLDLFGIDPRTAEYIVQAHASAGTPNIYFPILHEDPSRDASWSYGAQLRQLGYLIFAHACHVVSNEVAEYYRKGPRIAASSVQILSTTSTTSAAGSLLNTLGLNVGGRSSNSPASTHTMSWWYLALSILIEDKVARGKFIDRKSIWTLFGRGKQPSESSSWECIHLHANLQAVLYSLRMLKQILSYVQRNQPSVIDGSSDILRLITRLEGMPDIEALFLDLRQLRVLVTKLGAEEVSAILKTVEGMAESEGAERRREKQEEGVTKTQKRGKVKLSQGSSEKQSSRNVFDILAEEGES